MHGMLLRPVEDGYVRDMDETPPPTSGRKRGNDLGETGRTVAANVRRLRRELDVTTGGLARALTNAGRPFLPNTITKIEQGQRRVDADDLMALAAAFGVTPNALLLPHSLGEKTQPTGVTEPATSVDLWKWACGDKTLPVPADPFLADQQGSGGLTPELTERYQGRFRQQAAPHSLQPIAYLQQSDQIVRMIDPMMKMITTLPTAGAQIAEIAEGNARVWAKIGESVRTATSVTDKVAPDSDALEGLSAALDVIVTQRGEQ